MSANQPEPAPIARTDRRPVWELVIEDARQLAKMPPQVLADMAERHAHGIAKYGVPLTSGNGRKHLVDAYQEALDLTVYIRAELDEREVALQIFAEYSGEIGILVDAYARALSEAAILRHLIDGTRPGG